MEEGRHLTRISYFDVAERRSNQGQQLGFDYRGSLYKKSVSGKMLREPKRESFILNALEPLMVYLVDRTKEIRKTFNYAIPRNSRDIN